MMDALCPCCGEVLYRTEVLEANVPAKTGGAQLQQDRDGPFVTCTSCRRRINLTQVPTSVGAPAQFRVAAMQDCGGAYQIEIHDRTDPSNPRKALYKIKAAWENDAIAIATARYRTDNPDAKIGDLEIHCSPID